MAANTVADISNFGTPSTKKTKGTIKTVLPAIMPKALTKGG